ncbi:MAG TPA: alpha-2-macroglobulin family protein, partial [Pyrinomonadaceae bacterium]
SAEGPLTTTAAQTFVFQTFSSLKFQKAVCGWDSNKNCSPVEQWYLEFNNQIDPTNFSKESIKIEPALENANIYPSGNLIFIQGYKKGRTTYKVTVDGSVKDVFGQTLGQTATALVKVGSAPVSLTSQGENMVVLDPSAKPSFSIYSTNQPSVKVRLYQVQPADWAQFQECVRRINYDDGAKRPAIPGKLVFDKIVAVENKPDEMIETRIDLSASLSDGLGNVIVDIEPTVRSDKYDRTRIFNWIQSTRIGLDAFVDNQELVGFATDLKTGRPLADVELSIYPNGSKVISQNTNVDSESGAPTWWNWLTGWGSSDDSIKEINSTAEDGDTIKTETIEEAQTNQTTGNGILRLSLPEKTAKQQNILIAKKGKDVAFLPENSDNYYYNLEVGSWYKKTQTDGLRWFVFDDRKMYRPNEEVAVKGYIRVYQAGKFGDIAALGNIADGLTYSVKDSRNNEIVKGTASLNSFGAFDFKFKLPDNANLGQTRIDLETTGSYQGAYTHGFQIQEFRRPEFEVSAKVESEAPHFVKESANVSVEAKYYAGGALANAETNWTVRATPTNYTPPNRSNYTFGTWVPWWRGDGGYDYESREISYRGGRPYGGGTTQTFKGVTDASGKHLLKIDFESVNPPRPYSVNASAAIQDVNRQTWSSATNLLVHPSELYVGIKTPRTFVRKGENIKVESIVTDIDGNLIGDRDVQMKAVLKDWIFDKGTWKEETIDEQICNIKSAEEKYCTFVAKQGGRYTITARVMDDRERPNESEITIWVPGGKTPPKRSVEQEEAQIIPDKKDYAPGDAAEILVISPFPQAEGVLTLRRDGLVKTERFSMRESSITLKIPLEERYLPNITAQVDLVGAADRTNDKGETDAKLAKRPAFASGQINLPISTESRKLNVSAAPKEKTLEPGGTTKIDVEVKDYRGEPVSNSEVAIVVVDESVLALSGYSIADPLGIFYTPRSPGVTDYHLRKDVILDNPNFVNARGSGSGNGSGSNELERPTGSLAVPRVVARTLELKSKAATDAVAETAAPAAPALENQEIILRRNFDALVVFAPDVKTDSSGKATVDVKLPDNLTRYRVTAIAVDNGKRFGKIESNITAKQPLMVRPSAPRFMNFGDKIELPVIVQNQTDKDLTVDVAVRATNANLTDGGGKRVVIKANDRAEIRFPVSADKAGTARFQIAATTGNFSDAAEISLPVWTPATAEAFATYGTTDENGAILQPIQAPADVYAQFGGLEVTTSSTQLQELTDAFIYLQTYPFECSEQVASRMISVAALKDVLTAFKAKEMPSEAELKKRFERDVEILKSRQNDNGYFGMWRRDGERYKYPFVTAHVAHALVLAKAKGYKVPDEMLTKVKPYLKNIETHFDEHHKSPEVRRTISAYALYVRNLMGDKDAAKAKKLLAAATIEKMPFEALGWILSVLADDVNSVAEVENIKRFLMNRTTETAATANFVTDYGDAEWLIMYSNRRADGVLLEA